MEYEIDTEIGSDSGGDAGQNPDFASDSEVKANAANPSLNSEIHAATDNQSNVEPEDYPSAERKAQTAVVIPEEERQR